MVRRINEELVATWGNLVNRTVSMTHRYFDGVIPPTMGADPADAALLARVDAARDETEELLRQVKLRAALAAAMRGAQAANQYLNDQAPWQIAKTDLARTGEVLNTTLHAVAAVAVTLAPWLPITSSKVLATLGVPVEGRAPRWEAPSLQPGTTIGPAEPLFAKLDAEA